jgi:HK97 family phage prohead protease
MERRERISDGEGPDFVISDGSLDRHGTRINPAGWELSSFNRNPIALFGHSGSFPVGRWENIRSEGDRLVGRLVLAAKGTSPRIDEIISLVEQGILRAVSVGFSVLELGVPGKSKYDYQRQELLEVSLVSVPSNTNALAVARSLNISPETQSLVFGEQAREGLSGASTGGHAAVETADMKRARAGLHPLPKATKMRTLSQRIEDAQQDLNAKRDRLAGLSAADTLDLDAIEARAKAATPGPWSYRKNRYRENSWVISLDAPVGRSMPFKRCEFQLATTLKSCRRSAYKSVKVASEWVRRSQSLNTTSMTASNCVIAKCD